MKKRYLSLCQNHEVNYVSRNVIESKMMPITDFSVMLRLVGSGTAKETFVGEKDRHVQDLDGTTNHSIDIRHLIGESTRITFLRGIAGIGKSVLAKQIVYGWASGTMYHNFRKCVYFECRQLNDYKKEIERDIGKKQLIGSFLKEILCGGEFQDGDDMLIIIDGLDELFDFKDKHSVIFQFLEKSNFCEKSQIILTGRPHAEEVLRTPRKDFGGYRVIEVKGLTKVNKRSYIEWFVSCGESEHADSYREFINQTINESDSLQLLTSVPQFLNTICCVSVLTEGRKLQNETELYSWTLYLLLKQHILEREKTTQDNDVASAVFKKYKRSIDLLCEISFDLYSQNKVIFKRDDYKPLFDSILGTASEEEKGFIQGLFLTVPSNFERKLQFKHLSVMEFCAAIHVCAMENPKGIIEMLMEKKMFEVVRYACGLCGGAFREPTNIIRCLFMYRKEADEERRNSPSFDNDIREFGVLFLKIAVQLSNTLERAIDFLVQFLSPNFVMPCVLRELLNRKWGPWNGDDARNDSNLINLYSHLRAIGVDDRSFLRVTLNFHTVHNINVFSVFKYVFHIHTIILHNLNIDMHSMKLIGDNLVYCNALFIDSCTFDSHEVHTVHQGNSTYRVNCIVSRKCNFSAAGFKTILGWANMTRWFILSETKLDSNLMQICIGEVDLINIWDGGPDVMTLNRIEFDETSWAYAVKLVVMVKTVMLVDSPIVCYKKLADTIEEMIARQKSQLCKLVIFNESIPGGKAAWKKVSCWVGRI